MNMQLDPLPLRLRMIDSRGEEFIKCAGCSRTYHRENSRYIADTGYMCRGCLGEEEPDEEE